MTHDGPLALKDTHKVIKGRQDVMQSSEFLTKNREVIIEKLNQVFEEIDKVE